MGDSGMTMTWSDGAFADGAHRRMYVEITKHPNQTLDELMRLQVDADNTSRILQNLSLYEVIREEQGKYTAIDQSELPKRVRAASRACINLVEIDTIAQAVYNYLLKMGYCTYLDIKRYITWRYQKYYHGLDFDLLLTKLEFAGWIRYEIEVGWVAVLPQEQTARAKQLIQNILAFFSD